MKTQSEEITILSDALAWHKSCINISDTIISVADEYGIETATIHRAWKDLANTNDDDVDVADYERIFDDYDVLPASCYITWQDNELIVLPFIDDDVPRLPDYPESFVEDVVYVVNDHGNITCQEWNGKKYVTVWDMV